MSTLPSYLQLLLLIFHVSLSFSSDSPSPYEVLERFGFPKGILPEGATSYHMDQDGNFEVFLPGDCVFHVNGNGYPLKYEKRITGNVKFGQLKELNGVSVKVLLVWFGINEVERSGADLYFYVGPISASFPLSNFEACPKCLTDMVPDSGLKSW